MRGKVNKKIFSVEKIVEIVKKTKGVVKKTPLRCRADSLLVLGSGWNKVVDELAIEKQWDFEQVFGVGSGVKGHKGKLYLGKIKGKLVWIMAGRLHTYEGYNSEEITRSIQALAKLGISNVILTSAAGGFDTKYKVGDIVVLSDIITIFCQSPLTGDKFQDLSCPFSKDLRKIANLVCKSEKISSQREGVYVYLHGPHYETFSDKKALCFLGADCVGMSTVPETIMANHLGLKVLGLSCITNLAFVKHSHKDVVEAAETKSKQLVKLLTGILGKIS